MRSVLAGLLCVWLHPVAAFADASVAADVTFSPYRITEDVEEDRELAQYLEPYRQGLEAFVSKVVGRAAEPLRRAEPECGLANLVADALLSVGREEFEAEIDFALTNYGGLRRDLPEGPLTMGLLMELSPFENYMVYLEVDGRLALAAAEAIAEGGVAVAGMEVTRTAEGALVEAKIRGERIQADRRYRMVTIDYLVDTWKSLFRDEWVSEKRVSGNLVQRDAIVIHLGRLDEKGIAVRSGGDGRVMTVAGERSTSSERRSR